MSQCYPKKENARLEVLRDEGLELLAAFRRIESADKRKLVMQLVKALADNNDESS